MADWNAELYSKFEKERTLPCYALVRVVETVPETVLDVGCGIGNSTQVLADTFPAAHIIGADNSPDMLRYARENASAFRMWEIMYFFEMPSHESILEWYRGTGPRPYLAQLCDEDKTAFEAEILDGIRKLYPVQKNGSIIFRFPRLFFTAQK